jgi:hypothetical protein
MAIYNFQAVRDEVIRACQPHSGHFGLSNTVTMRTMNGEIGAGMQNGKITWWLNGRSVSEDTIKTFIEDEAKLR